MKKTVAFIISVFLLLNLCACGKTAAPAREKTDTDTVAISAVILARDDVPADQIYAFVATVFDNAAEITSQHARGTELSPAYASSVTSAPYHPGAAKYFEEKGYPVASVKDGAGTGASKDLLFGTGGEAGTYYAYGGVLSSYVSGKNSFSVTALSSGGSQANIEDLTAGSIQLGFSQSDVLAYAFAGDRLFDAPVENLSVVAALYMEQVQIVTTNPAITSVADLKGKNVSIGAAGSGTYFNAIDVLKSYGMTENDIHAIYQSFGDSAESLKDGKIDAAFIVAGAPTTAITDLATAKDVYLVSLDTEHRNSLIASGPYYSAYTIPKETY